MDRAKARRGLQTRKAGEISIDAKTIETPSPLLASIESRIEAYNTLTPDSFTQKSFQDLTGQRIERIIHTVNQMEEMIQSMVSSFGIKL